MKENIIRIPSASKKRNIWLKVGKLLDGISSQPLNNAHIVYNSDSIIYAGISSPAPDVVNPNQFEPDLVLHDYTLFPGLIEAHAHLFLEGGELNPVKRKSHLQKNEWDLFEDAQVRAKKLIKTGIIAVRDAGDKYGVGLSLSKLYKSGKSLIPYIDSPGAAINKKNHYGKFMSFPVEDFNSPEECVASRVRAGAERIKLIATDIINFKEGRVTIKPQMSADDIKVFVKAAKSYGKQTFAHASGDDGIENVIEGGIDSVEHGFFIREDQLAKMRDRQITWVPTFSPVQKQIQYSVQLKLDGKTIGNLKRIIEQHMKSLLKAYEIGTPIAAGSDAGSFGVEHGQGLLFELELMEYAGLSTISVINAATGISSDHIKFREKFGQIKTGYKSRFILSKYSPLDGIANLSKQKYIIFDGVVYNSEEEMI